MHLTVMNCTACRPVKEFRTVEDIMLREQELAEQAEQDAGEAERVQKAKAEADAILMAVNNRPSSSSAKTDELIVPVNTADSLELCSTAELVELFAEYTEADEQQKQNDFFVSELALRQTLTLTTQPSLRFQLHQHPLHVQCWVTAMRSIILMIWCQKTEIYMFVLAYQINQAVCTMFNQIDVECTCWPDFSRLNSFESMYLSKLPNVLFGQNL